MRFDKKMKHDYIKYLAQFGLQTTVDDYKHLIRKCNPNALSDSLTQSLKRFFFDIVEVSVSEDKLKVVVKDRREVELGVITSHYADFLCYTRYPHTMQLSCCLMFGIVLKMVLI